MSNSKSMNKYFSKSRHQDDWCHYYNWGMVFDLPNPDLKNYFSSVVKGNDTVYTTPWIPKSTSEEQKCKACQKILSEWMPHLEQLKTQWPSLYEFESDLAAKVGPMSVRKPLSDRRADIIAYYEGILNPAEAIDPKAIAMTVKEFSTVKGFRPRAQEQVVKLMKLSTNSGNPFFTKRRLVVDKSVPVSLFELGQQYLIPSDQSWPTVAVLGWRGQEGGPNISDVKQRVVWMFPFAVNVAELQVYQPLIELCQINELVPAWVSMDAVDERITRLFDTKSKDDLIVCTDFTKFDQHFNSKMSGAAKDILTALLHPGAESRDWLNNVYPIKYRIPLAVNDHEIYRGNHGMGSGSGGTNADETLAHRALQHEAALLNHQVLNPNSMCLGDDGILTYPGITAKDVTDSYSRHGLEMNPEKQYESAHDCTYLRRWHHTDYRDERGVCVGVYSTARALGRLCMQERFYDAEHWGAKMVALRELSIIENVKHHPLKEEFVDFCMKRDKYRLGIDIPGFLDNIENIAKEATDLMPDFLGYTKSMQPGTGTGIQSWWIVRYLKSKR